MSSLISRSAVSGEHFSIVAHFDDVKLPWKPSSRRLIMSRWRLFIVDCACCFQNSALSNTLFKVFSADHQEAGYAFGYNPPYGLARLFDAAFGRREATEEEMGRDIHWLGTVNKRLEDDND
jgi:hypothetical protein